MYAINGKFNGTFRDFDLYRKLGIVSVTTTRDKESIRLLGEGEVFALFSSGYGFLGVGRVVETAVPFEELRMHQGGRLVDHPDYPFKEIYRINPHFGQEEYVMRVEWLALVPELEEGKGEKTFISDRQIADLDTATSKWVIETFGVGP